MDTIFTATMGAASGRFGPDRKIVRPDEDDVTVGGGGGLNNNANDWVKYYSPINVHTTTHNIWCTYSNENWKIRLYDASIIIYACMCVTTPPRPLSQRMKWRPKSLMKMTMKMMRIQTRPRTKKQGPGGLLRLAQRLCRRGYNSCCCCCCCCCCFCCCRRFCCCFCFCCRRRFCCCCCFCFCCCCCCCCFCCCCVWGYFYGGFILFCWGSSFSFPICCVCLL